MRTFVYHEILLSYLDYVRYKGFQQAFIWACPPLVGDDYILYAKPKGQKTPKVTQLTQWYLKMLKEGQKRNIVSKVTNMYDLYFNVRSLDASSVPYFEGDYIPGEAENIIKKLNKQRTKITQLRSSSFWNESLEEGDRDPVMQKLCGAIFGMKESFIVALLNCGDAELESLIVPQPIMEYRDSNICTKNVAKKDNEKSAHSTRGAVNDEESRIASVDRQAGYFCRSVRVLDDDAEEIDCQIFSTRQAFLDLCRGNHYQFDELRRAKHTSMMVVLSHLQNRGEEAPKFVRQSTCEISTKIYPDSSPCHDHNLRECARRLETISLTENQSMTFQENITVLVHASQCKSLTCTSFNCAKAKKILEHSRGCMVRRHRAIKTPPSIFLYLFLIFVMFTFR